MITEIYESKKRFWPLAVFSSAILKVILNTDFNGHPSVLSEFIELPNFFKFSLCFFELNSEFLCLKINL